MIFFPFPFVSKSVEYLHPEILFPMTKWWIPAVLQGGNPSPQVYLAWRYHHHFLADYGLSCLTRVERYSNQFPEAKRLFLRTKNSTLPLGPPEWYGRAEIHSSHKRCVDEAVDGRFNRELLIHPVCDPSARLKALQPRIRECTSQLERNG